MGRQVKKVWIWIALLMAAIPALAQDAGSRNTASLVEGHWAMAGELIGMPEGASYQLTDIAAMRSSGRMRGEFLYGNQVRFEPDLTFRSYYTAPCGNDCFPAVYGRYDVVDAHHIRLHLLRMEQHGMCGNYSKTVDVALGTYRVEQTGDGLRLLRVPE